MYYSINQVNWDAVFKCAKEYRQKYPGDNHLYYNEYMKLNWGIDHGNEYIRVVDEQKYMMFLLRWA